MNNRNEKQQQREHSYTQEIKKWITNSIESRQEFVNIFKIIKVVDNDSNKFDCFIYFCELNLPNVIKEKYSIIKNNQVYIKVEPIFIGKDYRNNGFSVERKFYDYIEKLVALNRIPHFTQSYGYYSLKSVPCPGLFRGDQKKIIRYDFIVLKSTRGQSLNDFLKYNLFVSDDKIFIMTSLYLILFQLFYVLRGFQQLNITHNDLHFNNIHVVKYEEPINLIYKIGKRYWKISSYYLLYIIDFDRLSNTTESPFNLQLYHQNFHKIAGQCNFYRESDTFHTMSSLYFYDTKKYLKTFFDLCFNDKIKFRERSEKYIDDYCCYLRLDDKHTDYFKSTKKIFCTLRKLMLSTTFSGNNLLLQIEKKDIPTINCFQLPPKLKKVNFFPINNNYNSLERQINCKENTDFNLIYYGSYNKELYGSLVSYIFPEIIDHIKCNVKNDDDFYNHQWFQTAQSLYEKLYKQGYRFKQVRMLTVFACIILSLSYWHKFDQETMNFLLLKCCSMYIKVLEYQLESSVLLTINIDKKGDCDIVVSSFSTKEILKEIGSTESLYDDIQIIINEIWKKFNGVLPITLPIL